MGFDIDQFVQAKLKPRQIEVPVPTLKDWFGDAEPVFKVRGLDGEEFYKVKESVEKRRDMQAIAQQLFSGKGEAIAKAVEEFYGTAPDEYVKQIETLKMGVVDPPLDHVAALKLVKNFPVPMSDVFRQIMLATGLGSELGESKGCGKIPESATTSTSATCGESASLS
jgi:hypothetical protein